MSGRAWALGWLNAVTGNGNQNPKVGGQDRTVSIGIGCRVYGKLKGSDRLGLSVLVDLLLALECKPTKIP